MEKLNSEPTLTQEEEYLYNRNNHGLTKKEWKEIRDEALSVANAKTPEFVEYGGGIMKETPDEDTKKELSEGRRN
ncbi:MAG: hypothetical protein WC603_01670 [Candidatus Paceibacterota bacterium]|jgi:hypothetical protein